MMTQFFQSYPYATVMSTDWSVLLTTALGITEDVEKYSLRGTRRKKGKKLDEDYLVSIQYMDRTPILTSHVLAAPLESDGRR
jgi:hypothetical protein